MLISFSKRDLKPVTLKKYEEYCNKTVKELISSLTYEEGNYNIYFIDSNNKILKNIDRSDIFLLLRNDKLDIKISELEDFSAKNMPVINNTDNLIYIYNIMRNRFDYLPVKDKNTGEIIGELYYLTISKKFYDILLKNDYGIYNEELFKLILSKYEQIFKNFNIGIIAIKPQNLSIIKNFYGQKTIDKLLKTTALNVEMNLRRIDMLFYHDGMFIVITFNTPRKVLPTIVERIKKSISKIEIDNISTDYYIEALAVPEDEINLDIAYQKIKYLIKRDENNNKNF